MRDYPASSLRTLLPVRSKNHSKRQWCMDLVLVRLNRVGEDRWPLWKNRILDLNTGIWDVEGCIVTVHPACPCCELLIRLLKEVKEELRRHVLIQYALNKSYEKLINTCYLYTTDEQIESLITTHHGTNFSLSTKVKILNRNVIKWIVNNNPSWCKLMSLCKRYKDILKRNGIKRFVTTNLAWYKLLSPYTSCKIH